MPRPSRGRRIGPCLENGSFRLVPGRVEGTPQKLTPRPRQRISKKKHDHDRRTRVNLKKAHRLLEKNKNKRPAQLMLSDKSDSASITETQSRWLNNRPYLLVAFLQSLVQAEIDRQKAIARASGNRRQERILENGYEFYTVTQVLVAYGKTCHICHEPIDLKASRWVGRGDWLLGLHVDHVVAIANGGPDTLANVRPSHAICNLKKGSKVGST